MPSSEPAIYSMPFTTSLMPSGWWNATDPFKQESSLSWHSDIVKSVDLVSLKDEFNQKSFIQL